MVERITVLLKKYLEDSLSPEERIELSEWVSQSEEYQQLLMNLSDPDKLTADLSELLQSRADRRQSSKLNFEQILVQTQVLDSVDNQAEVSRNQTKPIVKKLYLQIAAASVLLITMGWYLLRPNHLSPSKVESQMISNTALPHQILDRENLMSVLRISETDSVLIKNGKEILIQGDFLKDIAGGELADLGAYGENQLLDFEVPNGATLTLQLSDGTKVWLNSSSKFALNRTFGHRNREVYLEGEAYFDVKHQDGRPFYVKTDLQNIRVLGTTFNVKAYQEDKMVTTTLLSGSVEIEHLGPTPSTIMLVPGEIAVTNPLRSVKKADVQVESQVSWQRGSFVFKTTPFNQVIRDVARWYDIEVVYLRDGIPEETFTGQLGRDADFEVVIAFFKNSGIDCRIENGKLLIL